MKIVIDTNVWISALVFGGNPRTVFEIVVKNGHTLIVSEQLYTEIRRKLHKKFPNFVQDFEALKVALELFSSDAKLGSVVVEKSRDTKDDYLLEMVEISRANLLITGDKDLLILERYGTSQILKPKEALEQLDK